ncbi:hypothetical protein [Oryzicola mucosus]|uniref:Uncharacterized protein n=1 Tax=Oryzicola mucosus TaxID=2767425 RepID=A0A8J6TXK3_9HYPH|nr:hypothetical protein [Oryzicola mucosus]MBD0413394.1 hypothetical protein [Oryzicola mucosus]
MKFVLTWQLWRTGDVFVGLPASLQPASGNSSIETLSEIAAISNCRFITGCCRPLSTACSLCAAPFGDKSMSSNFFRKIYQAGVDFGIRQNGLNHKGFAAFRAKNPILGQRNSLKIR